MQFAFIQDLWLPLAKMLFIYANAKFNSLDIINTTSPK